MHFRGGAGKLDRFITLQRLPDPNDPDAPKNDFGELTSEPTDDITDIRAAYEPIGSRDFPEAQKRHVETTARFRIRYGEYRDVTGQPAFINVDTIPGTHRLTYVEDYKARPNVVRIYRITHVSISDRKEFHIEVSGVR